LPGAVIACARLQSPTLKATVVQWIELSPPKGLIRHKSPPLKLGKVVDLHRIKAFQASRKITPNLPISYKNWSKFEAKTEENSSSFQRLKRLQDTKKATCSGGLFCLLNGLRLKSKK
jgi:hypothetical protein